MKIGIIVYSQTGNTKSVALKVQEKLLAAGHTVNMEEIKVTGDYNPGTKDIPFKTPVPDAGQYDALVIAAPVQAFSLCAVMKGYLAQCTSLQNKKAALLTTQAFPFPWLGGNRAIRQMKRLCESKGALVCETGIVNWGNKERENMITDVVDRFSRAF